MDKRPMLHMGVAFLLGDILIFTGGWGVFAAVLFVICNLIIVHFLSWKPAEKICFFMICTVFFVCGFLRAYYTDCEYKDAVRVIAEEGDKIVFEGKLSKKETKNGRLVYYISDTAIKGKNIGKILFYPEKDMVMTGSVIKSEGEVIAMHKARNEGAFDEEEYYYAMGITAKVKQISLCVISRPCFSLRDRLFILSGNMRKVFDRNLPGEEPGLLAMMTIGEDASGDREAKELFSKAGLSHIFAISGLHISLVGMAVFGLFRKRGISFAGCAAASLCIVILYVIMVGESVSALRAAGMFAVFLAAKVRGKAYDPLSSLCAMICIILFFNPLAVKQMSFVFSFGAVAAIIIFVQPVILVYHRLCAIKWEQTHKQGKGRRWHISFLQRILTAILWGTFMQLSTLPLVAYYIYSVPVYVVLLNLLLIPFLGILLGLGIIGGLLGCLIPAAGLIIRPCHYILYMFEYAAHMSSLLPFSSLITGRPAIYSIAVYYSLLYILIKRLAGWIDTVSEEHDRSMERLSGRIAHQRQSIGGKRPAVLAGVGCIVIVLLLLIRPSNGFEIDMLYVGQGDCIYIDSGMGRHYMIDGGSTSEALQGKYTILPFLKSRGVRGVDIWFLTHMDEDHISGFLEAVEEGYPIKKVMLAKRVEKSDAYYNLMSQCRKKGIKTDYMDQGDRVVCKGGFFNDREMQLCCIFPDNDRLFEGANENSLVLYLQYFDHNDEVEFNGLFTGDIGVDQEEAILSGRYGSILRKKAEEHKIDLLKAAHHGSNGSNGREWLSAIDPGCIIISAGVNNRYHHPGKEAVARMDELGLKHKCTIEWGQIKIRGK